MFIGNVEKESVNFARKRGSKDKAPRKKRFGVSGATAGKAAAGLGALAAVGAGVKNRKAIGAAAQAGLRSARRTAGTAGGTAKLGAMAAGDAAKAGAQRAKGFAQGMSSATQGGVRNLRQNANAVGIAGEAKVRQTLRKTSGALRNTANKLEKRGRDVMANRRK